MSTIAEIQADLVRGKAYYSGLNAEHIADLKRGCYTCTPANYLFLGDLIKSLEWEVTKTTVSDIAEANYQSMLLILGDYVAPVMPSVDAGVDKFAEIDDASVVFNAIITQGTYPIASILWTQLSGTPANLTNATTANLTVSGFAIGESVFQIKVTDTNGDIAIDTVMLTGVNDTSAMGYYGTKSTGAILNYAQIIAGTQFVFTQGADITVPFDYTDYVYGWFAIPADETVKNYYQDTINPLNKGNIGTDQDLINAPTLVTGAVNYNFYILVYPNPIPNPLLLQTI